MRSTHFLTVAALFCACGCSAASKNSTLNVDPETKKPLTGYLNQNKNTDSSYTPTDYSQVPRSMKDIKKPVELYLSYAAWETELGNFDSARQSYQSALEKDEDNLSAHLGLASLQELEGNSAEAEKSYRELTVKYPQAYQTHLALGTYLIGHQNFQEAEQSLSVALKLKANDKSANFHYAVCLTQAGRPEDAIAFMSKAVGEAAAYYNISRLVRKQGNAIVADAYLQRARQLDPSLGKDDVEMASFQSPAPQITPSVSQRPVSKGPLTVHQVPMQVERHAPPVIEHSPAYPLGIEANP